VRLLGSIENSFNQIWGVRKARSWVRKLSDYLTMVIVTPLFLVIAIGVTGAAQNSGVVAFLREELALGFLLEWLLKSLPILVGWFAFTLVYLVMPNRRCKVTSALIGGFVGGTLWQIVLVLHIRFQVGIANYNAIYAGFAALPVFLVWVQTSWVIVLLGAEVAFAHESEPDYRGIASQQFHHPAFREQVALRALTRVCDSFLTSAKPPGASEIAALLGLSPREVREVLDDLRAGGLVAVIEGTAGESNAYVPARDPASITVVDVLSVMRGEGLDASVVALGELDARVDKLLAQMKQEIRSSAYNRSLRELVEESRRREATAGGAAVVQPEARPS
jgi:membrane protein